MANFFVTVGQQYPREPHPHSRAHRDGWFRVEADNATEARWITFQHLGPQWSMLYPEDVFEEDKHYYPLGELDVLKQTPGMPTMPEGWPFRGIHA